MSEMYQMIADETELKWFFDNVLQKPMITESYAAVFVARFKKLSEEERAEVGISKREAEFMATQTFRVKKIHDLADLQADDGWTFENFKKHVHRFNVDKQAYTTSGGYPLPEKCLAVIFYVNPCDEIKVADEVSQKLDATKTAIVKAMLNGKDLSTNLQSYQSFSNIESNVKHARAHCKGSVYWLDFDIDVPAWFKFTEVGIVHPLHYFAKLKEVFDAHYGQGNYLIVDTSGGYHVLVRTAAIKGNPHNVCNDVYEIYRRGCLDGNPEYRDERGNEKFECIVNDSQIPGIPLPGTYQYGRPVRILNKQDFNPIFENKVAKSYFNSLYNIVQSKSTTN